MSSPVKPVNTISIRGVISTMVTGPFKLDWWQRLYHRSSTEVVSLSRLRVVNCSLHQIGPNTATFLWTCLLRRDLSSHHPGVHRTCHLPQSIWNLHSAQAYHSIYSSTVVIPPRVQGSNLVQTQEALTLRSQSWSRLKGTGWHFFKKTASQSKKHHSRPTRTYKAAVVSVTSSFLRT